MKVSEIKGLEKAKKAQKAGVLLSVAVELMDNACLAVERDDETAERQTAGAMREFLDTLPPEFKARDWHGR